LPAKRGPEPGSAGGGRGEIMAVGLGNAEESVGVKGGRGGGSGASTVGEKGEVSGSTLGGKLTTLRRSGAEAGVKGSSLTFGRLFLGKREGDAVLAKRGQPAPPANPNRIVAHPATSAIRARWTRVFKALS